MRAPEGGQLMAEATPQARERLGNPWLTAYAVSVRCLQPVLRGLLRWRLARCREEAGRVAERYGVPSKSRPPGPLLWVHAVSVGEAVSVLRLLDRIQQAHGPAILFTTTTVSGARLVERYLAASGDSAVIHQYLPLDSPPWTRAFLDHWQPDAVLWVESDLWPQMIAEVHRRAIPSVLVNARLSSRSARVGRWLRPLLRPALQGFHLCLASAPEQVERLQALGTPDPCCLGNLKAAPSPVLDCLRSEPYPLERSTGDAAWIAVSTHPGEEEIVLEVHRRLSGRLPGLLTVIAPRDVRRADHLAAMAAEAGVRWQRKSRCAGAPQVGGVYIVDTMGELGEVLPVCPVAFMGGSLVPRGGHNPFEPLHFGAVVVHGPRTENFREAYQRLRDCGGSWEVTGATELAIAVEALLADPRCRSRYRECAQGAVIDGEAVTETVFDAVNRVIADGLTGERVGD